MKTLKLFPILILILFVEIGCKKAETSKDENPISPLTWDNLDGEYRSENTVRVFRSQTLTPGLDTTYIMDNVINTVYNEGSMSYKKIEIKSPHKDATAVWITIYPDGTTSGAPWMGPTYWLHKDTLFFRGSYGSPKFHDTYLVKGVKVKK